MHQSGAIAVVGDADVKIENICSVRSTTYVYGEDGSKDLTINSITNRGRPCDLITLLKLRADVAVTKQGYFAVSDKTAEVKLFDINGKKVPSFSTSDDGCGDKSRWGRCITVNSKGSIFLGNYHEQLVTVHNADDFTVEKEINVSINPCRIAANSSGQVCVVSLDESRQSKQVVVFDNSGNEVFTITPMVWGNKALPIGVAYDEDDHLMLAVRDGSIKKGGHVHQYGKKGEFLQCIIKGVTLPSGIAVRNSTLAIADGKSVLIYKGEQISE